MALRSWTSGRLAPLSVFLLAGAFFSINLGRPPAADELYHAIAAQHLIETGRPVLDQGEYWRGLIQTWMVAVSYAVFGEGLISARIPSVLFVALTAAFLFAWVRSEVGKLAAWLTAAFFISSPFTVEIAQFVRFYGLQMFSFVVGAYSLYRSFGEQASLRSRVVHGILACAFFAIAAEAQVTSLVGLVGVGIWVAGLLVQRVYFDPSASGAAKKGLAALFALAVLLVVVVAARTRLVALAWEYYRETPLFAANLRNEFWFYHLRFLLFYPTLWSLVGVLTVLAVVHRPRFGWYCASIFGISFVLMSLAGFKATRYLSFAPPFLIILWAIALAYVIPPLQGFTAGVLARLKTTIAWPERLRSLLSSAIVAVVLAILAITNPFWLRTATVMAGMDLPGEAPTPDWRAAQATLEPWVRRANIVVAAEELGSMYFLGRADISLSASKLREIPYLMELPPEQYQEFDIDPRTGRPVISTAESLEHLMQCFPRGLVVGPISVWEGPVLGANAGIQDLLSRRAQRIDVPEESKLHAWGWSYAPAEPRPFYCSTLSRFSQVPD